jgi:hypothetical protein
LEKPSKGGGIIPVYRSKRLAKVGGGTWNSFAIGLQNQATIRWLDRHEGRPHIEIVQFVTVARFEKKFAEIPAQVRVFCAAWKDLSQERKSKDRGNVDRGWK